MANNKNEERDFDSLNEEEQREIVQSGGKAAHEKDTAHEFDSAEAKDAAQKRSRNAEDSAEGIEGGDLIDDFDR